MTHTITMRNLRAYFGRTTGVSAGRNTLLKTSQLNCKSCGKEPVLLKNDPRQWWNQPQLEASRIMVIGCGAIGNEVVKNLVMMGIQHLTLIDFDDVEPHNRSRSVLFNSASLAATDTLEKWTSWNRAFTSCNPRYVSRPSMQEYWTPSPS